MAANMFILVDGAPGDATEVNHTDWIVIESATWEVERAVDMVDLGSNQRSHANTNMQKIEVTSQIGKASNKLALSVANGTVRPEIEMHWCRSGDSASEGLLAFSKWKFKNAIIDKYSISASADGIPEETWAIAYIGIEHEYFSTSQSDGSLKKENDFLWNLRTGVSETYGGQ
ncbi:Hcp family type VI secretion system effector [Marimonas sp. MJW-29]|uniref:Hcp family type VI secretion system effector n=1 Tax=Sulfitobacter sediminis TaxID=3234186 RepID=A0ABV3RS02_9RHOB